MPRPPGSIDARWIDQHNRVVLPKSVTDALHVGHGDHVAFLVEGHEVKLKRVRMELE